MYEFSYPKVGQPARSALEANGNDVTLYCANPRGLTQLTLRDFNLETLNL